MPTPTCHRTLRPFDSGAIDADGNTVWITNGTPCLGSRCAAWAAARLGNEGDGSCGLAQGQFFPDPARPTTRITTKKVEP